MTTVKKAAKRKSVADESTAEESGDNNPVAAPVAAIMSEEDIMQNGIQNGATITITPAADIKGGELIVMPALVAVAVADIAEDAEGACATEGVFELPKDGTALAQGQAVYATTVGVVTATSADNTRAGVAWENAAGPAATVAVKINA